MQLIRGKTKRALLLICVLAIALPSVLSSCTPAGPAEEFTYSKEFFSGNKNTEKLVADNGTFQLFIDETTTLVKVVNKKTMDTWYQSPVNAAEDTVAVEANKDKLFAALSLCYADQNDALSYVNSYTAAVKEGQYTIEYESNAVTVTYTMGDLNSTLLLPMCITKRHLEEQIFPKISEEDQKTLLKTYRLLEYDKLPNEAQKKLYSELYPLLLEEPIYMIGADRAEFLLKPAESIMREMGLTYDEMYQCYDEIGYKYEKKISSIFVIPMKYSLLEDGINVELLSSQIKYDESNFTLLSVNIMEYFGAVQKSEQGYMYFPSGSGGLIYLDKDTTKGFPYTRSVYGRDLTTSSTTLQDTDMVMMPVFGMNDGEKAFLAIIEDNAAVAKINADVQGRITTYNNIYPTFTIRQNDTHTMSAIGGGVAFNVYEKFDVETDSSVRYILLDKEHSSYSDMANAYRDYLIDTGALALSGEKELPLFINILGALSKQELFFLFQTKNTYALTSFADAQEILEELMQENIKNINVQYEGWVDDGLNRGIYNTAKAESKLGKLSDLIGFCDQNNLNLFMGVNTSTAKDNGLFDGFWPSLDALLTVDRKVAYLQDIDFALEIPVEYQLRQYPLSIKRQQELNKMYAEQYKKLGITGVSLLNFTDTLYSSFKSDDYYNRQDALEKRVEMIENYKENGISFMASRGNAYLYGELDAIYEMPIPQHATAYNQDSNKASSNSEIDQRVPFAQILLHGYIPYSTVSLNDMGLDKQYMRLKMIETGSSPYYTLMKADNELLKNIVSSNEIDYSYLYSIQYDVFKDDVIDDYVYVSNALKDVYGTPITKHAEVSKNVFVTYFGSRAVYVNYNDYDVTLEDGTVKAMNYLVVEKG